jgi:hypothetical protein
LIDIPACPWLQCHTLPNTLVSLLLHKRHVKLYSISNDVSKKVHLSYVTSSQWEPPLSQPQLCIFTIGLQYRIPKLQFLHIK